MKKSLVALAALAVAGIASAQSSVTLFGIMDVGISHYSNKSELANGQTLNKSLTAMSTSGLQTSRIGFRGTEDLGGGLAASFWLEGGLKNDTGAGVNGSLDFTRRSTVSLSGNFGEVRLGRDLVPTYLNDSDFDPFGNNGVGTNLIYTANTKALGNGVGADGNYARASNSIGYFLPSNLGGFYGQLMYALDEQARVTDQPISGYGRYAGGRIGYANGPLNVALAYGQSSIDGVTNKHNVLNLGASYDFGVVKAFGEYSNSKAKLDAAMDANWREPRADGWLLGVTVPVGQGLIRASYSAVNFKNTGNPLYNVFGQATGYDNDGKADKFAIGYVHNLSKRTALYATVARLSNKGNENNTLVGGRSSLTVSGSELNGFAGGRPTTSTGYDFGIRHSF